jgi:hypothetical protein
MNWSKFSIKPLSYKCRFDFETGYLVQSPCRCCIQIKKLPECARACQILARVQDALADTISCTRLR